MNDINITATEWTVKVGDVTQTITQQNGGKFVVRRQAQPWTQWQDHLSDGGSGHRNPRPIHAGFDTLEEATKFAIDLVTALVDVQTAHEALDAITGKMRVG